jgi:hypothetical protein
MQTVHINMPFITSDINANILKIIYLKFLNYT